MKVEDILVHSKYRKPVKYYDIAVLKTQNITLNQQVNKVCLPQKPLSKCGDFDKYKNDLVTVTGYGSLSRFEPNEEKTMGRVHINIYEQE